MPDLFDMFQGLMGRPDPRQQLASALGQGPGQPGSPAGPQPFGAPPAAGGPPGAILGLLAAPQRQASNSRNSRRSPRPTLRRPTWRKPTWLFHSATRPRTSSITD
jgi:hypothetical protein